MEKAEKIRLLEEKVDSLLKEENAALKLGPVELSKLFSSHR